MINPGVDIVFKKIFGVEQNKDILISLLSAIVSENDIMILRFRRVQILVNLLARKL